MEQDSASVGAALRQGLGQIRWWLLGPCLAFVVAGLAVLALNIAPDTKYFLSGALLGVGAGGALAEISAAFERRDAAVERRDLRERLSQLREPVLAQCRLAYRMGEFYFPFYAALSKGEHDDRHVKEMLVLGDSLGVRATLEQAVRDANSRDANLDESLRSQIGQAMSFAGQHLLLFFKLGNDILAIRGDDAKSNAEARTIVAKRIGANLGLVRGFTDNRDVAKSWKHVITLWDGGRLEAEDVDDLLFAFHGFLVLLGLEQEGFLPWSAIIDDLGKLKIPRSGSPAQMAPVLAAIRNAKSTVEQ